MTESDQQLVERANGGDADAFETLYYRHRDWVVSLAYRFTGDREEALDVLQETFSYLFKKFPGCELAASLRTMLYPAVKHLSIDRIRRRRSTVDIDAIAEQLPQTAQHEAGTSLGLAGALAKLSAAQREVVTLRFADDMTLVEIAEAVGAPLGTVKSRLHHALDALRKHLG